MPAAEQQVLYWNFEGNDSSQVTDRSGNRVDGKPTTELVPSPAGNAARMSGSSGSKVSAVVPLPKRFPIGSWTFMAAVRPEQFEIDKPQNTRRLFSYGNYPAAYAVIEIGGDGHLRSYIAHKEESGKAVGFQAASGLLLTKQAWNHIAVVCDSEQRAVRLFINGYLAATASMPSDFDANLRGDGNLTVGSDWQNYFGLVDEVRIFSSAIASDDVRAEYDRLDASFHFEDSDELRAAKRLQALTETLDQISAAWQKNQFDLVRQRCDRIVNDNTAPVHFRSYAQLRLAQSYLAQKDPRRAIETYQLIAKTSAYPSVHRDEAQQSADELIRLSKRLPMIAAAASRTSLPGIGSLSAEVFVGVDGNDEDDGSRQSPFATLRRARDEVRKLRKSEISGPIAVTILPGLHAVTETFDLASEDTATAESPTIFRADKKGTVTFYGGRQISGFKKVTDANVLERIPQSARDAVWQCDLKSLGVTDFGKLQVRGFGQPASPPTLELFIDRKPMTLARWPNEGFVGIEKLVQPGSRKTGEPSIIQFQSDRHQRWTDAPDAWMFGYFHYLWADATLPIGKIDPVTKTLTTAVPYQYGGNGMSTEQGIQYYVFNLLEEIDQPGEWYLDRSTGMLYVYPPSDLENSQVEIGLFSSPMIQMQAVSHIDWIGLNFDLGRFNAIQASDCSDCWFVGCEIGRFAGEGLSIRGGKNNRVIGCDLHTFGRTAMTVIGGDRKTLEPGGHLVENCQISDFGRIDRTYTPAIQLEGVGHRVAHNLMHHAPSSAMRIEGNDHLIEFNEVHSVVLESDDQGALELFRNPTYRGVVFRHNYLHHIGKADSGISVHGQAAIRFDDAISGMLVYGNVFLRCSAAKFGAIQFNSGRDNLIENNLFLDCKYGISGGWRSSNNVWKYFDENRVPADFYQTELYLKRYPKIATMLDKPGENTIRRNIFYRCGDLASQTNYLDLFQNGWFAAADPGVRALTTPVVGVLQDCEALRRMSFKPIPKEQIGLYESPARASWPVNVKPVEQRSN